jgi:hypothetical protein
MRPSDTELAIVRQEEYTGISIQRQTEDGNRRGTLIRVDEVSENRISRRVHEIHSSGEVVDIQGITQIGDKIG